MRSKKQVAAGQQRTLRAMREKVIKMQADWDGVDQCNMNFLDELANKIEETSMLLVDDGEVE